jgi:hypothetical protein
MIEVESVAIRIAKSTSHMDAIILGIPRVHRLGQLVAACRVAHATQQTDKANEPSRQRQVPRLARPPS